MLQDTITYVESKSTYYQTGHIQEGIHNSQIYGVPVNRLRIQSCRAYRRKWHCPTTINCAGHR